MADPIGTVRREDHDEGHSIWVRQDPGYPDNCFYDTDWTCIWSTVGKSGDRIGEEIVARSTVIGQVPGSPAQTGSDVEIGDRVRVLAEPYQGELGKIINVVQPSPRRPDALPQFRVQIILSPPESRTGDIYIDRSGFELMESL